MTAPPSVPLLRAGLLLARKELRTEARSRSAAQAVALFAGLVVLLFSFALGSDSETLRRFAPGLLWLAVALASLLAVGRTFASEQQAGTLEPLLLYPVPREALFLGKALATFVLVLAVAAGALGLMFVLYALPAPTGLGALLGALVAAPLGLALAGTFYGALSANLSAREALVPMLMLPVLVPVLIAATQLTTAAFQGGDALRWLVLLAAFDVALAIVALAVFPYVVER